jgi:hypothetical protein
MLAEAADRAAARFGELLAASAAIEADRALASELAIEARPVAYALLEGIAGVDRIEPRAPELREAIALASLLGRRAAILGATPTAAVRIAEHLLAAIPEANAGSLLEALSGACIEGYVAAREDVAEERASARAAAAIPIVELAPGVFAIFPAGVQEPEQLERVMDELGRRMLERDARACVVHVAGVQELDRERAAQIFAAQSTCSMLGVYCVFSGIDHAWERAAREARIDLREVVVETDLHAALRGALARAGYELSTKAALGDVLKRWISPRRGR